MKKTLGGFLLIVLISISTYKICATTIIDPDLYWHSISGKQLLSFDLDYNDLYWSKTTENYSDLKFTWLGDIALCLVIDNFGAPGLIILRILCTFLCCFFIYLCGDRIPNFYKIGILLVMIVAMYEKYLIRNSMFAMPLLGMLLFSLHYKKYKIVTIILLIWSCTHGSFLLGIGITGLHLFGNLVEGDKDLFKPFLMFVIVFLIISFFHPITHSYFSVSGFQGIFTNGLFGKSASVDFQSPFSMDRMHLKFVTFFAIATILLVKIKNSVAVLIFSPVVYFGLSYIRMTAYIPIVGAYILFVAEKTGKLRKVDRNIYLIAAAGLCFFLFFKADLILFKISKTGLTASKMKFPDKNAEWLLKNYPGEKTFNTISNGGFLLTKWYPNKKVWIDTHWAPHTQKLYDEYAYFCNNPDALTCHSAIICFNDYNIIQKFRDAKTWHAKSIDQGSVVFMREPSTKIQILFTQDEIDKMTKIHETILGNVLFDFKLADFNN